MDPSELQAHLDTARQGSVRARGLAGIVASCWPGGSGDRTERAALAWVRQWGPQKLGASVPACGCSRGHCPVCN